MGEMTLSPSHPHNILRATTDASLHDVARQAMWSKPLSMTTQVGCFDVTTLVNHVVTAQVGCSDAATLINHIVILSGSTRQPA
jgi:hypothetical protein